jgi:hypothetical protein
MRAASARRMQNMHLYRHPLRLPVSTQCTSFGLGRTKAGMQDKALLYEQRSLFMNRFHFAAALISLAIVTPASAKPEAVTFKHEGVTYKYTVKNISETKRVISGYATPGASFHLIVTGDDVSGTANGTPVNFTVSEAKGRTAKSGSALIVASR